MSEMDRPTPMDLPVNPNATINGLDPNPNLYAVIINGADQDRYWNDISAIYCTLLDVYGYTEENIFVHYVYGTGIFGEDFNNDGVDDIDYDAYKTSIHHTFQEMSGETNTSPEIPELGPDDGLFIFVDDHGYMSGGHSYINLPGGSLADYELAEYLEDINCAQIIAVLEPCQIGGFKTELSDYVNYDVSCKNRSIQTASNDEYSFAEVWITGMNYDEFVYYWTAAARGYYPHNAYPWEESHAVGSFPFYNYPGMVGHPGDHDPDLNGDGHVQMEEAFEYANDLDTWSEYGYYYPNISGYDPEDPQEFTDISFNEDLLSLCGIAGHVNTTQSVENRSYLIGGDLIVDSGYTLTLEDGGGFYFGNEIADFTVETFATLFVENNVSFYGNSANQVKVDGDIQVGNYVSFNRHGNSGYFNGLYLTNPSLHTVLNYAAFTKSGLNNYGQSLTIKNSSFANCNLIRSHRGNVIVTDGTIFDRTWLYLENTEDNLNTATVTNCIFITDITMAAIDLWNYNQYNITNNTIHGYYNGIQMFQSGYGELKKATISDNTITNCTHRGILAYNSRGAFYRNHIYDNGYGVWLADHSSVRLFGDYNASTNAATQEIRDNQSYEVYASQYSFPPYFRYNVIIDDDNLGAPGDPLVFHSGGNFTIHDVKYNCWEDIPGSFVATEDLYPGAYLWQPTWCPGDNKNNTPDPDEDMYEIAGNLFDAEDYAGAKTIYQTLIDQYPQSKYAKAAMQELFALEKFVANDYSALKQYYATNATIQSDTALFESAAFLSSKCDVKTENWLDAISYYENIILDPETMEDSIFAIIDLGYVYFVMENSGYKSAHTGNLAQYKPETKEQFFEDRDYLLSLLPDDKTKNPMQENLAKLNEGELLQNVPNPFNGTTQIGYKLENESTVQLNIYNYTGQLISRINEGTKTKGTYQISFDATGLTSGIYFYSISINGQPTDARKMTVLK